MYIFVQERFKYDSNKKVRDRRETLGKPYKKLRKDDMKLLELLKYGDSSLFTPKYAELARKTGMPIRAVKQKIKHWEECGLIKSYIANINGEKMSRGFRVIRLVRFKASPNEVFTNYLSFWQAHPEWAENLVCATLTTGHYDSMLTYEFANVHEYHKFKKELDTFMGDTTDVEDLVVEFIGATEFAPRRSVEEFEKVLRELIVERSRDSNKIVRRDES
jgi:DNA-binding Lrp family transcriptional regulator